MRRVVGNLTVLKGNWNPGHILNFSQAIDYLDVVESDLFCVNRGCTGKIIIALTHSGETEGFER